MLGSPEVMMSEGALAVNPSTSIRSKKCTKCGKIKFVDGFYKRSIAGDGRRSWCKECDLATNKGNSAIWVINNPERWKEIHRKHRVKSRSTGRGKLNNSMTRNVYKSLKNGSKAGRKWEGLVGYTLDHLKSHIEKLFVSGMSWENYGKWHVDHKIPISAFNFETSSDLDFKRCWALDNLQPLWALDNIRKNARIDKPFQPSLAI